MRRMLMVASIALACLVPARAGSKDAWTTEFPVSKADLSSTGRNPYFVLEPGHYLVLRGGGEELKFTVLDETLKVDGVETRVVQEYETNQGALTEISRNYYAVNRKTGDLYYFGEEVDMYRDGRVFSHGGSWRSGIRNAKFGMMMPGKPAAGFRHYQEQAPGVAMDRAEIVSTKATIQTPAGTFSNCVNVAESTPMSKGAFEHKYYAQGVGLIKYERLELVDYGKGGVSALHKASSQ